MQITTKIRSIAAIFLASALIFSAVSSANPESNLVTTKATTTTLKISVLGTGSGVLQSSPVNIINCTSNCENTFPALPLPALVTLFAAPNEGSKFGGWSKTGACAGTKGPVCVVKMTTNLQVNVNFAVDPNSHTAEKALLLLHGLSGSEATWNEFAKLKFNNSCAKIVNGVVFGNDFRSIKNHVRCYRLKFGMYDHLSKRVGLEGTKPIGLNTAGDFSTFNQLGLEVRAAVRAILNRHPKATVVLLGHSRGGIAARAFLQTNNLERDKVIGLLTTGTPHKGSQLGRIYAYLNQRPCKPRSVCENKSYSQDWEVVDFLNDSLLVNFSEANIDVRRPNINDLSDKSNAIKNLNKSIISLPSHVKYGQLSYPGVPIGVLAKGEFLGGDVTCSIFNDNIICPNVTSLAKNYLLGTNISPNKYIGDGIVAKDFQVFFDIPGFPKSIIKKVNLLGRINLLHTNEPEQDVELDKLLKLTMTTWWTSKN